MGNLRQESRAKHALNAFLLVQTFDQDTCPVFTIWQSILAMLGSHCCLTPDDTCSSLAIHSQPTLRTNFHHYHSACPTGQPCSRYLQQKATGQKGWRGIKYEIFKTKYYTSGDPHQGTSSDTTICFFASCHAVGIWHYYLALHLTSYLTSGILSCILSSIPSDT